MRKHLSSTCWRSRELGAYFKQRRCLVNDASWHDEAYEQRGLNNKQLRSIKLRACEKDGTPDNILIAPVRH